MLEIGSKIPNIILENEKGEKVDLSSYKGTYIVLYAYPKDNTPGCTTEACSLRDTHPQIKAKNGVVLGISPDSPSSHQKFIDKYELTFSLLSDPDHSVLEYLGAWGEKSMYGKTYFGVLRSTFIFDTKGELIKVYPKVTVATHGQEISDFLETLA
ncbi:MAG: thioredoxin-dependent thiol peroxidase [Spirochaetia bacterium]|nr:thioredoxin-dependent thiol peroxidase [Spirochaetia bacterium]